MKKIQLSVIIPVFNEADNLFLLCEKLTTVLKKTGLNSEIIFVDDGSTDKTLAILKKLKGIKIIQLRKNFGQSAALDAGIKQAQGKILVTLDGDGQNDPADIPRLLKKLDGFDCVCGWRYQRQDPFLKKFISRGAAFIGRFLVDPRVHDSGCTLRAYKKECFEDLDLYGEMHRMIPALLRWRGFKITEIKVSHHPRQYGQTKYNWKRVIKGFVDMIHVWFWRKYASRPMHVFGAAGVLLTGFGLILLILLALARLLYNYSLSNKIWPLLGFFSLMMGLQFFVFGILATIIIESKEKKHFYKIKRRFQT